MAALLAGPKREVQKRGTVALVSGVATLGAFLAGWTFLGIVGIPVTGWLTWRWFRLRAQWGMRF